MKIEAGKLVEKWEPILEHEDMPEIKDPYKKAVTAVMLENQEKEMQERATLTETTNVTGGVEKFDPVLISLIRRSTPNLIAFDVMGVQPMSGPTGLIFAMRSRYGAQNGTEALFNEADTGFSGSGSGDHTGDDPFDPYTAGSGEATATVEQWGTNPGTNDIPEMAFSIEKISVTAQSRALKAEYTVELAQDLKAIHGLDAETELSNILSSEIMAEINREMIRKINITATQGAQVDVDVAGTFDLDTDSNGRWSVEKFKGLMFQIERDANQIARDTRRGKGNILLCSSDVAAALQMAGILDFNPALQNQLSSDDTGNTFAGVLNGRYRVYIDPYVPGTVNYYTVGYKGSSAFDAGLFYCPYVPLQMVRAMGEQTFQPKSVSRLDTVW
jgi:hypothetical protein